jgi:hypothetical protein
MHIDDDDDDDGQCNVSSIYDHCVQVICAFYAMLYNGIKAAPIWDGARHKFVGK